MFRSLSRRFKNGEPLLFGVFVAVAAVAVVLITPPGGGAPADQGWTQAPQGPLGPADRDLLVKVRLAGLWEIPNGRQAQQRAASKRVKEVGMHLMTDHLKLDEEVHALAAKLNVTPPGEPNADQKSWMAQLTAVRAGAEYDLLFAKLLRQAHGLCARLAPDLVHLDEHGYPVFDRDTVPAQFRRMARRAVEMCPALALRVAQGA